MGVFRVRGAHRRFGQRGLQCGGRVTGRAGGVEIIGTRQTERLVRIVAGGAIHGLRRGLRFDKTGALLHQVRVRNRVDLLPGICRVGYVERHMFGKRARGTIVVGSPTLPQHRRRGVQMALLAHVQAALERKMRRIHDGLVDVARRFRGSEAGLDVHGPRPVASFAPDPVRHRLVFAVHKRRRARIAVVASHAAIRNKPVETGIGHFVSGAQVPFFLLGIPGQGEFEVPPAFFHEIRPRRRAAAHDVLHFADEDVRLASVRPLPEFFEPETVALAVRTIGEAPVRVLHDHAVERLDHGGGAHGIERIRHAVLLESTVLLLMAVETGFVPRKIGGQVPKTNRSLGGLPGGGPVLDVRSVCAASGNRRAAGQRNQQQQGGTAHGDWRKADSKKGQTAYAARPFSP